MIITCNKCSTSFNLDDSLVKEGGSKCRCAVCNHILTAYPLPLEPEPVQPETEEAEPWQSEPEKAEPKAPEPWEIEQTSEKTSDFDYESDLDDDDLFEENSDMDMDENDLEIDDDFSYEKNTFDMEKETPLSRDPEIVQPELSQTGIQEPEPGEMEQMSEEASDFNFESDLDDDDLFKGNSDLEMEDLDLSSKDSDIEIDNSYLEFNENDLEIDDDFSFKENTFDLENEPISFDEPELLEESELLEEPEPLVVEKDDPENEESIILSDPKKADEAKSSVTPEKEITEDVESLEKETETKIGLPEEEAKEVDPPPKKERKVIVKPFVTAKPKPIVTAKPKPTKKKKKSFFRIPVIILLLIFLLAIGAYIASVITGYKLPVIDEYIKKPIPEISEAKPIPNQKSVNGRFVTNSTAGTLFVITGRIENPSNIAYSHIEIRGALITKNKEEAKIKNVFCGNIITEDMLKTGNISDINTLLTLKEGAHKINVNVAPGASVPFMVVFSDLPEKLENFTIKVAGFDKAINKSIN